MSAGHLPPLAERMRPRTIEDFIGQEHILGPTGILQQSIRTGQLPSLILWGPPGVGKTTLARILAQQSGKQLIQLSAIQSGVKDIRSAIDHAKERLSQDGAPPVLFIDEIHRFNKAQQDALLGAVEDGTLTLIGATTENPSFEVNNALLSRCQVFVLESLSSDHLRKMLGLAIQNDILLQQYKITVKEDEALLRISGGDGRKLYNALDLMVQYAHPERGLVITNKLVTTTVQQHINQFDKKGEWHYDIISAFIKSIRGSDPNAAIYYLARMITGGEDPKFIARRLVILAAEDIGLANPNALLIANMCFEAVHKIGWPEGRIPLAEATIYLACSPKSNSAYMAIDKALEYVKKSGDLPVPLQLRNAPTTLMNDLGYGQNYKYSHDFPGHFVPQDFLPQSVKGEIFYRPADNQNEERYVKMLSVLWKDYYAY